MYNEDSKFFTGSTSGCDKCLVKTQPLFYNYDNFSLNCTRTLDCTVASQIVYFMLFRIS